MPVEVGQKVPNVSLIATDRTPVQLADLLGRPTVLLFFPGAFTGVCTKEMCTVRDDLNRFTEAGAPGVAAPRGAPQSAAPPRHRPPAPAASARVCAWRSRGTGFSP